VSGDGVWGKGSAFEIPCPRPSTELTCSAIERCELFRSSISKTAMRPVRVVVAAPGFDLTPRVEQIAEPAHVEAFLAQAAVETFHVRVLDGLARPDVDQLDASFQAPGQTPGW